MCLVIYTRTLYRGHGHLQGHVFPTVGRHYRTLHSYKLFWAVCHLFPQRWRTLNIQSREAIGQEDHVTCLKLRPHVNLSPAFGATYKTRIFYKYVVFKHRCFLLPNFFAAATHSLQRESTGEKSNTMDGPRRHSYTMTMRRFPVSEKLPVSNHKKGHFKLEFFYSLVVLHTHTLTHASSHIYTHYYFVSRVSNIFYVSM